MVDGWPNRSFVPFRAPLRFDFNRNRPANANRFSPFVTERERERGQGNRTKSTSGKQKQKKKKRGEKRRIRNIKESERGAERGREAEKGSLIFHVLAHPLLREFSFHFARPPTRYFISRYIRSTLSSTFGSVPFPFDSREKGERERERKREK